MKKKKMISNICMSQSPFYSSLVKSICHSYLLKMGYNISENVRRPIISIDIKRCVHATTMLFHVLLPRGYMSPEHTSSQIVLSSKCHFRWFLWMSEHIDIESHFSFNVDTSLICLIKETSQNKPCDAKNQFIICDR